jgi:hypothetical protein
MSILIKRLRGVMVPPLRPRCSTLGRAMARAPFCQLLTNLRIIRQQSGHISRFRGDPSSASRRIASQR